MDKGDALEYLNWRLKVHPKVVTTKDLDMFINFSIEYDEKVPNITRQRVKELAQFNNDNDCPIIVDILINSLCNFFKIETKTINPLFTPIVDFKVKIKQVVNYY